MKYDGLIKKFNYDPAGFGTVQETYKDAKKVDSSITVKDVRDWFERNVERKNNFVDLTVISAKALGMSTRLICLICVIWRTWRTVIPMVF